MKRKRLALAILAVVIVAGAGLAYAFHSPEYPPLKDGDLIFETSSNPQATAILIATASLYTHMGIIKTDGDGVLVVEAAATVKETPLADWVKQGVLDRVAIYRDPDLTPEQAEAVLVAAEKLYGRPYDIFFSFNNEALYCSELPYRAFKAAGIDIGKVQKISDLYFNNSWVKRLIEQRWQRFSECTSRHFDFPQCYNYILEQKLVSPASIAADSKFKRIYSNYPL
jgi:hypothetical protein